MSKSAISGKSSVMIARIWHGRTRAADADRYLGFLKERAIPDYRSIPGNQGVYTAAHYEVFG